MTRNNTLQARKHEVIFVSRQSLYDFVTKAQGPPSDAKKSGGFVEKSLRLENGELEIEEDIIQHLSKYHEAWMALKGGWTTG